MMIVLINHVDISRIAKSVDSLACIGHKDEALARVIEVYSPVIITYLDGGRKDCDDKSSLT